MCDSCSRFTWSKRRAKMVISTWLLLVVAVCLVALGGTQCSATLVAARMGAGAVTQTRSRRSPLDIARGFADEFVQTVKNSRDHLKAGAAARGISIFLLYPLDTLKTRLQMSPAVRATMPPLLLQNVFRGVFGSLAGQIPYGMLTFGSYEVYKGKLLAAFPGQRKEALYVAAAIAGDLTGSFWLCPSEVVKQQLQG